MSLALGPVVTERISSSAFTDFEGVSLSPVRKAGLSAKFPTDMLLSTLSRSTPEALAIGGQLSRDTRRFSESVLFAADRLLERAAEFPSALAGD